MSSVIGVGTADLSILSSELMISLLIVEIIIAEKLIVIMSIIVIDINPPLRVLYLVSLSYLSISVD